MTIPIIEIFNSLEGEGRRSGKLCTFIRTAGCNLRCSYCDTKYSFDIQNAPQLSVEEIFSRVQLLGCKMVTITGGEPLLHEEVCNELIPLLLEEGYDVNIETNGSIFINKVDRGLRSSLMFTIDWKCPSSGANDKMLESNLLLARPCDVIKFVVGSKEDLIEMERIYRNYETLAQFYVSPVFEQIPLQDIVQFLKDKKLYDITMQIQIHKIIWDKNMRGV